MMLNQPPPAEAAPGAPSELTSRQREVLVCMAQGLSTKEIAAQLGVSIKTVETHRAKLMKRIRAQSVAALVLFAVKHRLVVIDGKNDEDLGSILGLVPGSSTCKDNDR